MASTSETGHEVNVENFGKLIALAESMGPDYKPTSARLKISSMQTLQTEARKVVKDGKEGVEKYSTAVNNRQAAFDGIKTLSTRIMGALKSSDAGSDKVEDAQRWHRLIQGTKKSSPDEPKEGEKQPRSNSVSQQSFDKLRGNLEQLVLILKGEPEYKPEEDELKVATLEAYIDSLQPLNKEVNTALSGLKRLREARDKVLYLPETGLVDVALKMKEYVKSINGATGPIYKEAAGIPFRRPSKD